MNIDLKSTDPIKITTEAGNTYELFRYINLHPKSRKPDDYKNKIFFRDQKHLSEKIFDTVFNCAMRYQIKPKSKDKILKIYRSVACSDDVLECVFLEDCIPFEEEDFRFYMIPREEFKTAYQWKTEDDRDIKAGAVPIHKEFETKRDYVIADYYHISDTEPIVYKTKNQWKDRCCGVKYNADFIERELVLSGVKKSVKFYHEKDTYSLHDLEACDEYGGDLRTERQWERVGRLVKDKKLYEEKTFTIRGETKTYRYYHRDNTYLI